MSVALDCLVWVGGSVLFAVVGVLLGRRLTRHHVREGHNDVLVPIFLTAGVVYAVLLAFIVIAEWEFYDTARANVAEEAALLVPMYRATGVLSDEKRDALRHTIRAYAEGVIKGWEAFGQGHRNLHAGKAVTDMFNVFATLQPATKARELISAQFLATFNQVILDRNKRYLHASESLSWLMWAGSIGGGAIVIGMCFFLYMERTWPHVVMVSILAALIGLLFFMLALFSRPFVGPLALEPEPFETALKVFDTVDKGF